MTVSNKTMERIMRQDSNLSPYDGFRIGGIGKVLNQIGLNQRKHHIIYKISSGEFAIPMEFTGNVMEMQKEYIEIPRIFKEFAKVMAPDPIRIPRIEDRITGYKGKEKDLARVLTPQEIRVDNVKLKCPEGWKEIQVIFDITKNENFFPCDDLYHLQQPVVGRYEGMLDIAGHEFLVAGVAGWKMGDQEFAQQSLEFSLRKQGNLTCYCRKGFFTENPDTQYRNSRSKIMIGGAFGTPWFRVLRRDKAFNRIMPINFRSKRGNRDSIIKEHISLGLIEPGISAYSSPGFLEHIVEKIRNFPDILKDKKQLQSFLGVVNFAGIFIKDLAKYRKDFRPLLKETDSAKWKWEEIHTQRIRELKQVCNNLPKLAIPQDEDELVVYTDANDYRWAAVLMKKTTTGEEPCRYTGGLFTEQQAQVWHINEKEFFAVWKAFKKWPLFLLAKEFTLKVDNTNVKAFLKNKLESKN
ncbi:hypothetical protein Sango_2058700 [Sesamum angolense]|uniref:Reverse transcriptase RNase H-like domain-containing protein n=1 Tax=Sesamum angolense TaxID=2727404 RepID=A0AAE2BPF6_9LAMI|nr:hypothetical protein Sango_2058700 [Sesamum angolense]